LACLILVKVNCDKNVNKLQKDIQKFTNAGSEKDCDLDVQKSFLCFLFRMTRKVRYRSSKTWQVGVGSEKIGCIHNTGVINDLPINIQKVSLCSSNPVYSAL